MALCLEVLNPERAEFFGGREGLEERREAARLGPGSAPVGSFLGGRREWSDDSRGQVNRLCINTNNNKYLFRLQGYKQKRHLLNLIKNTFLEL